MQDDVPDVPQNIDEYDEEQDNGYLARRAERDNIIQTYYIE